MACVVVLVLAVVEAAGHRGSLVFGTQTGGEEIGGHLGSVEPCMQTVGGIVVAAALDGQRGSFDSGVHLGGDGVVSDVTGQRGSFDPRIHLRDDCVVTNGLRHPGSLDPGGQIGCCCAAVVVMDFAVVGVGLGTEVDVRGGTVGQRESFDSGMQTIVGSVAAIVVVGQRGSVDPEVQVKGRCVVVDVVLIVFVVVGQRRSVDPGVHIRGRPVMVGGVVVGVVYDTGEQEGSSDPGLQIEDGWAQRGSLVPGIQTWGGTVEAIVVGQRGSLDSGVQAKGEIVVLLVIVNVVVWGQFGSLEPGIQSGVPAVVEVAVVATAGHLGSLVPGKHDGAEIVVVLTLGHRGSSDPGTQVTKDFVAVVVGARVGAGVEV